MNKPTRKQAPYVYYKCVPMKASVFPSVTCATDGTSMDTKRISKRFKPPPVQRRGPVTFDSAWKKSVPSSKKPSKKKSKLKR